VLNLCNNQIDNELVFQYASSSLRRLELDNNNIRRIVFEERYDILTYISITNNKLEYVMHPENIANLEYLIAENNEVAGVDFLKELRNMKKLNLNNNLVKRFEGNLCNIESIELSGNGVEELIIDGDSMPNLKLLRLSGNKLSEVRLKLSSLIFLDLSNNDLKFIEKGLFTETRGLKQLDLSFNFLDDLNTIISELEHLPDINELNLIENRFNKDKYDIDIITSESFSCIYDYCKDEKYELLSYRSFVILRLPSLINLDLANISKKERDTVIKPKTAVLKINPEAKPILSENIVTIPIKFPDVKAVETIPREQHKSTELSIIQTAEFSTVNADDGIHVETKANDVDLRTISTISFQINTERDEKLVDKELLEEIGVDKCERGVGMRSPEIESPRVGVTGYRSQSNSPETKDNSKIYTNSISLDISTRKLTTATRGETKKIPEPTYNDIRNKQTIDYTFTRKDNKKREMVYKVLKKTFTQLCDKKKYISYADIKTISKDFVKHYNVAGDMEILLARTKQAMRSSIIPGRIHILDLSKVLKLKLFDNMFDSIAIVLYPDAGNKDDHINNIAILRTPLLSASRRGGTFDKHELKCSTNIQESCSEDVRLFYKRFFECIASPKTPVRYGDSNKTFIYEIQHDTKEYSYILKHLNRKDFKLQKYFNAGMYKKHLNDVYTSEFLFENRVTFLYIEATKDIMDYLKSPKIGYKVTLSTEPLRVKSQVIFILVENKSNPITPDGKGDMYICDDLSRRVIPIYILTY
jgi:hypothetical protein